MPRRENTRELILKEALSLFSVSGFSAVSVRDIARAVHMKESSLYNHFQSKQAIFDAILAENSSRANMFFQQVQLTDDSGEFLVDEAAVEMYRYMTDDEFCALAERIFDFYFTDEISVKLRKMLTLEQYRSDSIAQLYRKLSFDDALMYQSLLFSSMIKAGLFIEADPYAMALAFFSPVFLISYKYDNTEEGVKEAKELFLRHIRHFNKTYAKHDTSSNLRASAHEMMEREEHL